MESLAARLAWSRAPADLGALIVENDSVLIETPLAWDSPLARAWRSLKRHWNVFYQAGASASGRLALHYASLDWAPVRTYVATWGFDILRALELIRISRPPEQAALFAHPRAFVDLSGHVKLAFVDGPPRALDTQPVLVAWVRDALAQLVPCGIDGETLRDLAMGYRRAGGHELPPRDFFAWDRIDRAAGWLAMGNRERAGSAACRLPEGEMRGALVVAAELLTPSTVHYFKWHDVVRLIEGRPPRDALEIVRAANPTGYEQTLQFAQLAIAANDLRGVRFDELVARRPHDSDLVRGLVVHLLARGDAKAALVELDRWLATSPDDPVPHALRGRALKLLGHPERARAAHDEAAKRGYLPSQFARTNLDRDAKQLRIVAGSEGYRDLAVPEHLRDVVPLLSQGRLLDAILWLTDRYADPEARALLASCYEYAGDIDSARHIYEQDGNSEGVARCLGERIDELFV